jgi:hypothetical protein
MSDLSPLSGVKRKSDFGAVRSAYDPTETWGLAGQKRKSNLEGGNTVDVRFRRNVRVGPSIVR